MKRKNYLDIEDLEVYKKSCRLHIEDCDLTHNWPQEEKYELGSQARRSSNSAPAQLAEKNDDRHIRNKIEGVNLSRGEAGETIHHLFIAKLKGFITEKLYQDFRDRYKECIRMLNGLEKTLEQKVPERERRWQVAEESAVYGVNDEPFPKGCPLIQNKVSGFSVQVAVIVFQIPLMKLERPTSNIERPTSNEGIKRLYQLKQVSF